MQIHPLRRPTPASGVPRSSDSQAMRRSRISTSLSHFEAVLAVLPLHPQQAACGCCWPPSRGVVPQHRSLAAAAPASNAPQVASAVAALQCCLLHFEVLLLWRAVLLPLATQPRPAAVLLAVHYCWCWAQLARCRHCLLHSQITAAAPAQHVACNAATSLIDKQRVVCQQRICSCVRMP